MHRYFYLDNLCAILLLYIVFIHHIANRCGFNPELFSVISSSLSFFMSWFFFKGGMMHKKCDDKEMILKSSKRLLIPFLIFLFLGFIIDGFFDHLSYGINPFGIRFIKRKIIEILKCQVLWPTAASWFLLSLFFSRVLFNFLSRRIHPLLISAICLIAAYSVFLIQHNCLSIPFFSSAPSLIIPFYIGNICHGLAIYSLGYYLREKQFQKIVMIIALGLYLLQFFVPARIDFRTNDSFDSFFPLAVIYGIAGCVVFNNLFKVAFNFKIPIISYIGRNSMVYYLIHWPVMYVVFDYLWRPFASLKVPIQFCILSVIVLVSCIISDWFFTRHKNLRFIIGG